MTRTPTLHRSRAGGFALIEVLVTLLILLIGLLGLAGLLVQSQRYEVETYQRAQALVVLHDIVERIKANRQMASCYVVTTDTATGSPYLGSGASPTLACGTGTTQPEKQALADLGEWHNVLLGGTERIADAVSETRRVGGLVNARGCVSFDSTTNVYTVTLAWQGLSASASPTGGSNCATGQYGVETEGLRRAVTVTLQLANLSAS